MKKTSTKPVILPIIILVLINTLFAVWLLFDAGNFLLSFTTVTVILVTFVWWVYLRGIKYQLNDSIDMLQLLKNRKISIGDLEDHFRKQLKDL